MPKCLEIFLIVLLAIAGVFTWRHYALKRYEAIDLSVNQAKARVIASSYVKSVEGLDLKDYQTALSFNADDAADRYLQKTLGVDGSKQLIHQLHYDLFYWIVRFFKEKQKEEFRVAVSSQDGRVIGYHHTIPDSASRPFIDQDHARQRAIYLLTSHFNHKIDDFSIHREDVKKFDHRLDYTFSWERKDIDIPWDKGVEKGHAKVLVNVIISGGEILGFNNYQFDIPDAFNRYVDNLKETGQNLTLLFKLLYLALLAFAVFMIVNRKQEVIVRVIKNFYGIWAISLFVLMYIAAINLYPNILFEYSTTQSLNDYIIRQLIEGIVAPFFTAVVFMVTALVGESLALEIAPGQKNRGFLSGLLSSFWQRPIATQVFLGYAGAAIILGVQAFIYHLGFKYCGVWDELSWVTNDATAILPCFSALVIGLQAALSEESMFRLFAINFLRKYRVPTVWAVLIAATVWGFGHTGYEVFPMWFRGLEVAGIGLVMGLFYLRYGFICVLVAHFLIDVFYSSLPYLLKPFESVDFYYACLVLWIPLIFAVIAFMLNRKPAEKPLKIYFSASQEFNYQLIKELYQLKTAEERLVFKKDLERHNWDPAIIQHVFESKA